MLSWRKPGFVYFFRLFFRRSPQPPQELLSDPVDIFLKSTRGQDGANLHRSTSLLCTKLSNAELQTFVLRGFINFTAPQLSLPPSAPASPRLCHRELKQPPKHTHKLTQQNPKRIRRFTAVRKLFVSVRAAVAATLVSLREGGEGSSQAGAELSSAGGAV